VAAIIIFTPCFDEKKKRLSQRIRFIARHSSTDQIYHESKLPKPPEAALGFFAGGGSIAPSKA
jgi:hypothetical protein